jgi:flagellar hook-basal body complex protein FliE
MVMPLKPATFPMAELPSRINGATSSKGATGTGTPSVAGEGGTTDFSSKLREVLSEANDAQVRAQTASEDYASGKQNDLHGTMITMTEADISLRLVSNVRNRVIEAYREVMRMGS